ncbi:uncharacterized protein LOC123676966 isoform X2 [Harmonia axyridis]|uniref:uncharacterized protein LOC123676966 isoform X2 n=1 Tax=Harmonia axyridis TaxID=115357 RepID=UPI001E2751E6|nr:uncharacterized protein LOC123676966 isoform X2 [Harmonia axyridis]
MRPLTQSSYRLLFSLGIIMYVLLNSSTRYIQSTPYFQNKKMPKQFSELSSRQKHRRRQQLLGTSSKIVKFSSHKNLNPSRELKIKEVVGLPSDPTLNPELSCKKSSRESSPLPSTSSYNPPPLEISSIDINDSYEGPSSSDEDINKNCGTSLTTDLREWAIERHINHNDLSHLLGILRKHKIIDIPTDARSFLNTPRGVVTVPMEGGPALPPNIDVAIHSKNGVQSCSQSSPGSPKVYTLLEAPNCKSVDSEDDVADLTVADEASGYNNELISDPPIKSVEACCSNEKIINLLLDIKLEIANLSNKLTEQGLFNLENDPILENLPLKNLEDFQSLEGKLDTDPVLKKKLYKTYESIGGNDSRDFVIRCLKRSFTNDMAELCSWTGQKDNYKVADSPVMKILHSAVKKTTGVSEKDFEIYVKDWLRHAKQRKERMLKKTNKLKYI